MSTPAPLKIAVLGASGHIGRAITKEAISRGYHVTAVPVTPHPSKTWSTPPLPVPTCSTPRHSPTPSLATTR